MNRYKTEATSTLRWAGKVPPRKILAIRLQALGDVVITLPYLQALENSLPSTEFHFLTRKAFESIPRNMAMFNRIYSVGGERETWCQWASLASFLPQLRREKYDVILDLQRNRMSRTLRKILRPQAYSEFDRFSALSAGARTKAAIEKLGLGILPEALLPIMLRDRVCGIQELRNAGCEASQSFIVLNPAGSFVSRNWPLENYSVFAGQWLEHVNPDTHFIMLGEKAIDEKAAYLQRQVGKKFISLIGKTTPAEAFNILRQASCVITEDSGLMHMAWVARAPVVALFGSTDSTWSRPMGRSSVCLDSTDLECGGCMQARCRYGDTHCLTRYCPEQIVEIARELIARKKEEDEPILEYS